MKLKVLSLCSGYGGFEFGLNKANIDYEVIGFSEIDEYAIQCYNQNHYNICFEKQEISKLGNHSGENLGDLTKINPKELKDFDLLTAGFPCQSFSQAGKQLGIEDLRGQIIFYILKILEEKKPKLTILENVKGLTQKKFKDVFDFILKELDKIGYYVKWDVLNSKDYIVPQNRERVFFICYRKDLKENFDKFEFPKKQERKLVLSDILEEKVDEKYYLSEKAINKIEYLNFFIFPRKKDGKLINGSYNRVWHKDEVGSIGVAHQPNILENQKQRIRKLTPTECFRLMGFLDDEINLDNISNSQRYKLAGNGVDIQLVSLIFKQIKNSFSEKISQTSSVKSIKHFKIEREREITKWFEKQDKGVEV